MAPLSGAVSTGLSPQWATDYPSRLKPPTEPGAGGQLWSLRGAEWRGIGKTD